MLEQSRRNTVHHIGFIGIGTMGAPMARNLLKAGFALRVFDIEPKAVQALVSAGATAATSAADAARGADCVITMLPNGEHVEEAAFGKGGVAETLKPGSLFIDMSTIAPSVRTASPAR
jgi:3-hydroxyisobutyrate dehydrogenase-like beta-hydroxyacid dehydrogenase